LEDRRRVATIRRNVSFPARPGSPRRGARHGANAAVFHETASSRMNALYQAAADLQAFVGGEGWPFCIIGGLAVQRWGVQRATRDADMTVLTNFVNDEACISA